MKNEKLSPAELSRLYHCSGIPAHETIAAFREMILDRYRAVSRPMPWRETRDPYAVLVSEVMLQQTQVERVRAKYAEFLSAFPGLKELADASLPEVLRVWQGLGYNRRALALKRCSEEIVERYAGAFPRGVGELETLPGIGPYTARAVAAFAFGAAEPMIETNIRTVFLHFFFHGREMVPDSEIMPLVAATLDRDNPREWYYALMDFGVMLKQAHPNPGRRSRHHKQQSRFEGSNRQLRSRLLREILKEPGIAAEKLSAMVTSDQEAVLRNLDAMQREGFLAQQGTGYRIAGEKNGGSADALPPK